MKFQVKQNILLDAINTCIKAINFKNDNIFSCFSFELKDNILKILASDQNTIHIEKNINVIGKENGQAAIPAKLFSEIIRKLDNENINIDYDNKKLILNLKSKNLNFNIKCLNINEFQINELTKFKEDKKFNINAKRLKMLLNHIIFATSKDVNRRNIMCVNIVIKNKKITIAALDMFRIAMISQDFNENIELEVNIKTQPLNELIKFLDKDINIIVKYSKNLVAFIIEDTTIYTGISKDDFYDYKLAMQEDIVNIHCKINSLNLYNAIDRVSIICSNENGIEMNVSGNEMMINAKTDFAKINEKVEIHKEGDDILIGLNAKFINDALKVINQYTDTIELAFIDNYNPVFMYSNYKNNNLNTEYKYMILPMRL